MRSKLPDSLVKAWTGGSIVEWSKSVQRVRGQDELRQDSRSDGGGKLLPGNRDERLRFVWERMEQKKRQTGNRKKSEADERHQLHIQEAASHVRFKISLLRRGRRKSKRKTLGNLELTWAYMALNWNWGGRNGLTRLCSSFGEACAFRPGDLDTKTRSYQGTPKSYNGYNRREGP